MTTFVKADRHTQLKSADVVVIGSGIQGLCCAYGLIKRGITSVTVLESASTAGGLATQKSAAMLTRFTGHLMTTTLADRSIRLYRELGPELTSATGINVEFTWCGYAILGREGKGMARVSAEHNEHRNLGINPLPELITGRDVNQLTDGLFRFPDDSVACYAYTDGFVNIGSLTSALANYIRLRGGSILTEMPALGIESRGNRVVGIHTPAGIIKTENVVNAAGVSAGTVSAWVNRSVNIQPSKKTLVQIINLGQRFSGPIIECLDDGWYFRPDRRNNSYLMLVGVGFGRSEILGHAERGTRPEVESESISACRAYLRKWTSIDADIVDRISAHNAWAGYRPLHMFEGPSDGSIPANMPLFGKPPDTVDGYYECCGAGEFGVIFGPVGGNKVADEIVNTGLL